MGVKRVDRLEALLRMLRDQPGITAGELAAALGTSTRSVARDIALLRDRGYAVEASRGRGGGLWLHPKGPLGRVTLSAEEGLGILLGLAVAEAAGQPMFVRTVRPARARIVDGFPAGERARLRGLHSRVLVGPAAPAAVRNSWRPPAPHVMRKLQTAFVEARVVRLESAADSGRQRRHHVEPHVLLLHWPAWYLEPDGTGARTRLDRIRSVSLEPATFRPKPREIGRALGYQSWGRTQRQR